MFGTSYRPFKGVVNPRSFGSKARTLGAKYDQAQSAVVASRKAYLRDIPADAAITVSAGAEYSLDGGAWTSTPGLWGASSYIQCRFTSYDGYDTAITHTVTLEQTGGFPLQFPIMFEPRVLGFVVRTARHASGVAGDPIVFNGELLTFNSDPLYMV